MEEYFKKNEIIKTMFEAEYYPSIQTEEISLDKYSKFPLAKLSALGVAFEPLAAAFQNIVLGSESTSGILKYSIPKGGHLANFKDGSGMLGAVLDADDHLIGQARLNPLVLDPTMLLVAITLANIEQKLDDILETQKDIFGFLEQKEKSKLKGNLNYLADVMNNYKYNWKNEKYKNSNHIKVLDIKQDAEQSIEFYRNQINIKMGKGKFLHSNQDVKKKLGKIQSDFVEYQLALYLFSFSSFLEVMLLENFESTYLDHISKKIEDYSYKYRELYTKCYNQIDDYSKSSIDTMLIKGLASSSKVIGDAVAKVPIVSKSLIDETLIETSKQLGSFSSRKTKLTLEEFMNKQSSNVHPFIENINTVNRMYNQPIELIVDQENIYYNVRKN